MSCIIYKYTPDNEGELISLHNRSPQPLTRVHLWMQTTILITTVLWRQSLIHVSSCLEFCWVLFASLRLSYTVKLREKFIQLDETGTALQLRKPRLEFAEVASTAKQNKTSITLTLLVYYTASIHTHTHTYWTGYVCTHQHLLQNHYLTYHNSARHNFYLYIDIDVQITVKRQLR